tara:strand:- start:2857 stop:3030 length:174 start_codon:yes stop_codon:yes gene_type:complete
MRFDEDKSVDYNYEVGFLEGIRTALQLMIGSPSLAVSIQAVSTYVNEQVETVKEMDE